MSILDKYAKRLKIAQYSPFGSDVTQQNSSIGFAREVFYGTPYINDDKSMTINSNPPEAPVMNMQLLAKLKDITNQLTVLKKSIDNESSHKSLTLLAQAIDKTQVIAENLVNDFSHPRGKV